MQDDFSRTTFSMVSDVALQQIGYMATVYCDIISSKKKNALSQKLLRRNVIQNGAERKSISNPALLIPSLPTGREGTIEL